MSASREEELDLASRPIREAIRKRLSQFGGGYSSGWYRERQHWEFHAHGYLQGLTVTVSEDGTEAVVSWREYRRTASTPRGVVRKINEVIKRGSSVERK